MTAKHLIPETREGEEKDKQATGSSTEMEKPTGRKTWKLAPDVSIQGESVYLRVDIPIVLMNTNFYVDIGDWSIRFSNRVSEGMYPPKRLIYIGTTSDTMTTLPIWDQYSEDFYRLIKILNKKMEIDKQKGVRFDPDAQWVSNPSGKYFVIREERPEDPIPEEIKEERPEDLIPEDKSKDREKQEDQAKPTSLFTHFGTNSFIVTAILTIALFVSITVGAPERPKHAGFTFARLFSFGLLTSFGLGLTLLILGQVDRSNGFKMGNWVRGTMKKTRANVISYGCKFLIKGELPPKAPMSNKPKRSISIINLMGVSNDKPKRPPSLIDDSSTKKAPKGRLATSMIMIIAVCLMILAIAFSDKFSEIVRDIAMEFSEIFVVVTSDAIRIVVPTFTFIATNVSSISIDYSSGIHGRRGFTRVAEMPAILIDTNFVIEVDDWTVQFDSHRYTNMNDAPNRKVIISTLPYSLWGVNEENNWKNYRDDFHRLVKALNDNMELDKDKGVRFSKDGPWRSSPDGHHFVIKTKDSAAIDEKIHKPQVTEKELFEPKYIIPDKRELSEMSNTARAQRDHEDTIRFQEEMDADSIEISAKMVKAAQNGDCKVEGVKVESFKHCMSLSSSHFDNFDTECIRAASIHIDWAYISISWCQ